MVNQIKLDGNEIKSIGETGTTHYKQLTPTDLTKTKNVEVLGEGAYGKVYKLYRKNLKGKVGEAVAVKTSLPADLDCLRNEKKLLKKINENPKCHRCVPMVFDDETLLDKNGNEIIVDEDWLIMECAEKKTLDVLFIIFIDFFLIIIFINCIRIKIKIFIN